MSGAKNFKKLLSVVLGIVMAGAALLQVPPAAADNDENTRAHSAKVTQHGKFEFCTYCHGASGQGYRAYYTMPRLAGQTPEYLVNQLNAYAEGSRKSRFMHSIARSLSPATRAALASRFSGLGRATGGRSGTGHSSEGQRIFQEGLPDSNVAACAACHGLQAEGYGPVPRLAGQLSSYTQSTLANWGKERGHGGQAGVMAPVAASLSKSQMAALAAYLSGLK